MIVRKLWIACVAAAVLSVPVFLSSPVSASHASAIHPATGVGSCTLKGWNPNSDGCGSFEVSWLRCEDVGFAVFRVVDAFVFSAEVVAPVGVEVAAGGEGTELEDGLGSFQAPSRACYVHSVLYDVAACSFDDSGGDRPALGEGPRVAQGVLLSFQVAGAFGGAGALLRGAAAGGRPPPHPRRRPHGPCRHE